MSVSMARDLPDCDALWRGRCFPSFQSKPRAMAYVKSARTLNMLSLLM